MGKPLEVFRCNFNGVYRALDKINRNISSGLNIRILRILKEVKEENGEQLVYIYNLSLATRIVPLNWKLANAVPIFKKKCK